MFHKIDIKKYKVIDGTSFHVETSDRICKILNDALHNQRRLNLDYGDIKTGKSWNEKCDKGYIGRSNGQIKVPILLHNKRSLGGGSILDHRIIKISYANKKLGGILYQHPKSK